MATRAPKPPRTERPASRTTEPRAARRRGETPAPRTTPKGERAKTPRPARERKNMRIDQKLLDEAKRILGAETETEAVTVALERIVGNERILAGLRALGGTRLVDPRLVEGDLDED